MDKCPLCCEYFDQIVNHIINCNHWPNGESEDPVCNICKKSVADVSQHFISHHSRLQKCKICNARFFKMSNLKRHMKKHLRIYRFHCSL